MQRRGARGNLTWNKWIVVDKRTVSGLNQDVSPIGVQAVFPVPEEAVPWLEDSWGLSNGEMLRCKLDKVEPVPRETTVSNWKCGAQGGGEGPSEHLTEFAFPTAIRSRGTDDHWA